MNQKVNIEIEISKYADSVKDGAEHTSVMYNGPTYGGASPCDTPEEIKMSIANAKQTIRENGDTWLIKDLRPSASLSNWM